MPIYEFQCQNCGTVFDSLQRLSDPDPTECPNCDAPKVVRRLTAPSFRLAGSGWYETDFKKDGKRNLAGDGGDSKPAAPDAASEGKSEVKAEPKPEGKSESKPAPAAEPKAAPKPDPGTS